MPLYSCHHSLCRIEKVLLRIEFSFLAQISGRVGGRWRTANGERRRGSVESHFSVYTRGHMDRRDDLRYDRKSQKKRKCRLSIDSVHSPSSPLRARLLRKKEYIFLFFIERQTMNEIEKTRHATFRCCCCSVWRDPEPLNVLLIKKRKSEEPTMSPVRTHKQR